MDVKNEGSGFMYFTRKSHFQPLYMFSTFGFSAAVKFLRVHEYAAISLYTGRDDWRKYVSVSFSFLRFNDIRNHERATWFATNNINYC